MTETHGSDPISDSGDEAVTPESELDAELEVEDGEDADPDGPIAFS